MPTETHTSLITLYILLAEADKSPSEPNVLPADSDVLLTGSDISHLVIDTSLCKLYAVCQLHIR